MILIIAVCSVFLRICDSLKYHNCVRDVEFIVEICITINRDFKRFNLYIAGENIAALNRVDNSLTDSDSGYFAV